MSTIANYTEQNKHTYNVLFQRASEINTGLETDAKALNHIVTHLPQNLTQSDTAELANILTNSGIRIKYFESQLNLIEQEVNRLESNTQNFVVSLGQLKGNPLLEKNSLIQHTNDQLSVLRDGIQTNKGIIHNLERMIEEIKGASGADKDEIAKIRKVVAHVLEDEMVRVRKSASDCKDGKCDATASHVERLTEELEKCRVMIDDLKEELKGIGGRLGRQVEDVKLCVDNCKHDIHQHNSKITDLHSRLSDELDDVRGEVGLRVRNIERAVNNSTVKRYDI